MHTQSDTTSPSRSIATNSFHPPLLSTITFGANFQGSHDGQLPPEAPSGSPESALENGRIAARDHVTDGIVEEDEGEHWDDADAE